MDFQKDRQNDEQPTGSKDYADMKEKGEETNPKDEVKQVEKTVEKTKEPENKTGTQFVNTKIEIETGVSLQLAAMLKDSFQKTNVAPRTFVMDSSFQDVLSKLTNTVSYNPLPNIVLTNRIGHFYKINLKFGTIPQYDYTTNTNIHNPILEFLKPFFPAYGSSIPSEMYLSIDFNDPDFGFTVDPFSAEIITFTKPSPRLFDSSSGLSSTVLAGSTGFIAHDFSETIVKVLDIGLNILLMSPYLGRTVYLDKKPDGSYDDLDPAQSALYYPSSTNINTKSMKHQFATPTHDFVYESMYYARVALNGFGKPLLANTTGSLPNDDYVRYPHVLYLLPYHYVSTHLENTLNATFTQPLDYGSNSRQTTTFNHVKLSEYALVNQDSMIHYLRRHYHERLADYEIDVDSLLELLNSFHMVVADVNQIVPHTLFFPQIIRERETTWVPNHSTTYFPMSDGHRFAFQAAISSKMYLSRTFSSTYQRLDKMLSTFSFISWETSVQRLQSILVRTDNRFIPEIVSSMVTLLDYSSPSTISLYAAMSVFAPFMNIEISPVVYDLTRNGLYFGMQLLGLYLEKILFYPLWRYNKPVWIHKCVEFLKSFFREEYSVLHRTYGYGHSAAAPNVPITVLTGNKLNIRITNYTIERPVNALNVSQLLGAVLGVLSLEVNNVGVVFAQQPVDYSINQGVRSVHIPGRIYSPHSPNDNILFPLNTELRAIVNNCIVPYHDMIRNDRNTDTRMWSAYLTIIKSLCDPCDSIGAWFHTIYCPIIKKIDRKSVV